MTPIPQEKTVRWLHGEVKTPPFSFEAKLEAGGLLGSLQQGQVLSLPQSRPMPRIGSRCHELPIQDVLIDRLRVVALCGDHKVVLPFGSDLMCPHQPRNTMPATTKALGTHFLVNAWTAIGLLAGLMGLLDLAQ